MRDYRIILVEPAFEESIGFVARAMKNFGLKDLQIVNPAVSLGDQGRMRGGHAQDILDSMIFHESLTQAFQGLDLSVGTTAQRSYSATNLLRKPMTPRELGKGLAEASGHIGVVLGREGTGLNNHELSLCDMIVTIPAAPSYQTLNISHAAAILFYELYQAEGFPTTDELADDNVKTTILRYLSGVLDTVGLEEYKVGLTVRALKTVMGRSAIRRREASLIVGALREVSRSLSNDSETEKQDLALDQRHASAKRVI